MKKRKKTKEKNMKVQCVVVMGSKYIIIYIDCQRKKGFFIFFYTLYSLCNFL